MSKRGGRKSEELRVEERREKSGGSEREKGGDREWRGEEEMKESEE